jgi:Protein-tyrosine phosphatase
MDVWKTAADILAKVGLDRDSLFFRFSGIVIPQTNLTMISGRKKKNVNSNRYGNILPFDHNCVKVAAHAPEGTRGNYINASLLKVRACYGWRHCCFDNMSDACTWRIVRTPQMGSRDY